MSDRVAKLTKNTAIYAVGNFGSKLLSFVLLPVYMVYLAPEEFGQIDLYILASSLAIPVFTLQSVDAAYRRMLDAKNAGDIQVCVSNLLCIYVGGGIVFSLAYGGLCVAAELKYAGLFYLYIVLTASFQMFQQIARGLRQNEAFSASGVLLALVQGITNIALIVGFGWGAESLLAAPVIAAATGLAMLLKVTNPFRYIRFAAISGSVIRAMLSFSAPLCIHSLCWWCITSLGTYILTMSTGSTELSGVYALGNKFPQILAMINSIFFLAWQESAVEEFESKDASRFYGNTYIGLLKIEIGITIIFLPMIKIYFWVMDGSSYAQALDYIPALLAANAVSASISFFSSIFNVVKKTKAVFYSSIGALIVSMGLFVVAIPVIDVWGIVIGVLGGYTVLLVWRIVQASGYIRIQFNPIDMLVALMALMVFVGLYYFLPDCYQPLVVVAALVVALLLNRRTAGKMFKMLRRRRMTDGRNV